MSGGKRKRENGEERAEPGMDARIAGASDEQLPENLAHHRRAILRAPRPLHVLWGFLAVVAILAGLWILFGAAG